MKLALTITVDVPQLDKYARAYWGRLYREWQEKELRFSRDPEITDIERVRSLAFAKCLEVLATAVEE